MTKKAYMLTVNGANYALHLSADYDGIKDACGLSDMPAQVPDNIDDEEQSSILRKGKAIKVSIGLQNKKRRKVIMSALKPIKGLIGKSYAGSTIVSASIAQHIRLG